MKYLFPLFISTAVLFGCKKERTNPDDLITWRKYYRLDKITCDTIFAFYIPSAFTPNGDFINELWAPKSNFLDSSKYHIDIFDKAGTIILSADGPVNWDGKKVRPGDVLPAQTFGYYIEATDKKGGTYIFKGQFALLN